MTTGLTTMTPEQAKAIRRYTRQVTLAPGRDVSHCLEEYFSGEELLEDLADEDLAAIGEAFLALTEEWRSQLPEGYHRLTALAGDLQAQREAAAKQIDEQFAVHHHASPPPADARAHTLGELERLVADLEAKAAAAGREKPIGEMEPDRVEDTWPSGTADPDDRDRPPPLVPPKQVTFRGDYVLPRIGIIGANESVGAVIGELHRKLENHRAEARDWVRTVWWLKLRGQSLRRALAEFRRTGRVPERETADPEDAVKESLPGRPREIDEEKLGRALEELLAAREAAWHTTPARKGTPHKSNIYEMLYQDYRAVITKSEGGALSKKQVIKYINEFLDDWPEGKVAELRQQAFGTESPFTGDS